MPLTTKIISHLEKKIQLLHAAIESLKKYQDEERVLFELLTKEKTLDESFLKRSAAMRKAWERRKKHPPNT